MPESGSTSSGLIVRLSSDAHADSVALPLVLGIGVAGAEDVGASEGDSIDAAEGSESQQGDRPALDTVAGRGVDARELRRDAESDGSATVKKPRGEARDPRGEFTGVACGVVGGSGAVGPRSSSSIWSIACESQSCWTSTGA